MNNIEIRGAMRGYLRLPLFMLIPIAIAVIALGIYNQKLIIPSLIVFIIYAIMAVVSYFALQKRCIRSLVDMATEIETSQRSVIESQPIPYALVDNDGMVMWQNNAFARLNIERKLIRNILKRDDQSELINIENRIFSALSQKISENNSIASDIEIYTLILTDETEIVELGKKLEGDKLVVGNIYVDNYDEILGDIDDVKSSLLVAVIERKIRKYFGEADAIIRKLEKDRYFVVFPNRFLDKLVEDKFSLLEDIKNTKVGTDLEVTLSIGLGLNGDSYARDADFAKTATSIALGRGGSQVVIKNGGDVSIYGLKGKEVAKNARVKARVKAQALKELISTRDRVIIMGHKIGDTDCLGAGIGIAVAARELGKPVNIVINTVTKSLRPLMETFLESEDYEDDYFINSEHALELTTGNTLVVVVDTNRPNSTECPELLLKSNDVVVFDHHRQGKDKIEGPILSYIEPYASSTCEMVAEILQYFSENVSINSKEADALYAGMLIDTNNFMTKTGVRTFEAAAYLKRMGAEVTRVRKLLREDINAYRARAEIVRHAMVYKDAFAISFCRTPELESPTVIGAQAANELLNIVGIKASFVLTEYDERIYVSSRSIDEIDVQLIMERLGGGGHLNVAGAQLENVTMEEVADNIRDIIDSMFEEGLIK